MSVSCTELNMDSVSSSKMFVPLCQPSWHHIPETGIFIRCIVLMTRITFVAFFWHRQLCDHWISIQADCVHSMDPGYCDVKMLVYK
jgi:hypothetical protein